MRILVINRLNNLGDAMCHMRGLKEYKDKNPEVILDFVSCEYLHVLAAMHTDLFNEIRMDTFQNIAKIAAKHEGYDKVIEFDIDWQNALKVGILKAWVEKTLGFTPSTDKPYFIVTDEERMIAFHHVKSLQKKFRKLVLMQLEAPSGYPRSFKYEDWEKVLDLFPGDVGIIYTGPTDLAIDGKLKPRKNLILLPGYDIGTNVALTGFVDFNLLTHGGMAMMAYANDSKKVIHIIFEEAGSRNILWVNDWVNLVYKTHNDVNWDELKGAINNAVAM